MYKGNLLTISILLISLLAGCAPGTQSLIDQAYLTGDWTLVNQRMAALERLEARKPPSCPRGNKSWCINRQGKMKCSCVSDSEGRDMFESLLGL
jgi:hypothetical protein